jgi:DNA-binding NtrC family response regulator
LDYGWPGNTLQLASVVAHAVLLTDGDEISPMQIRELLGDVVPSNDAETISVRLIGGLKEIERAVVAAVIERCRGNKAEAARVLGLHRREVYRILQRKLPARAGLLPPPLALAPGLGACEANAYS